MSGEARRAASDRESRPEADADLFRIWRRHKEAERVSAQGRPKRERRSAKREGSITSGEARRAASDRESRPEADADLFRIWRRQKEAERVSAQGRPKRERRSAKREGSITSDEARRAASDRESCPEADALSFRISNRYTEVEA